LTDFSGLQAFSTPGGVGTNNLSSFQNPAGAGANSNFSNGGFGFFFPGPGQQSSGGGAPQNPQQFQLPANRLSSFASPPSSSDDGPDDGTEGQQKGAVDQNLGDFAGHIGTALGLASGFGAVDLASNAMFGQDLMGALGLSLGNATGLSSGLSKIGNPESYDPGFSPTDEPLSGGVDPGEIGLSYEATDFYGGIGMDGNGVSGGGGYAAGNNDTGYGSAPGHQGGGGEGDDGPGDSGPGDSGPADDGGADTGDGSGQPGDVYAYGGYVEGPGGPRDDAVPANLSAGEYVVDAQTVQAMGGPETFEKMQEQGQGFAGQPGGGVPQDAMQGGAPGQPQLGPNGMQPEEDPEEKKMRMREGLLAHAQNLLSQCT
jgi:hypothetical protein